MMDSVLSQPVAIIGAGVAGLINAHTLLGDGFTDVTVISRDKSVGGVWDRERVYSGLHINNVHGEYRFSALDMPPPENSSSTGGRLTGLGMCLYMETFFDRFLKGKAKFRFGTEVLKIWRPSEDGKDKVWHIKVKNIEPSSSNPETLTFSRVIVGTGGCSKAKIPKELASGPRGLHIFHSSEFAQNLDEVLQLVKPVDRNQQDDGSGSIVVVGGGKSAQDICAKLANEGRKVTVVFEKTDSFLAYTKPLPDAIRRSRFLGILMAHSTLNTRLERFLHQTWLGGKIVHFILGKILDTSYAAFNIPEGSPMRGASPLYWSIRVSDEGSVRPDSYHSLVNAGAIAVVSPARVTGYSGSVSSDKGADINLNDGTSITNVKVVILATGYQSSWTDIFSEDMAKELGIYRHKREAPASCTKKALDYWSTYKLLLVDTPPSRHSPGHEQESSIYRGIVPAKNIDRRDFAIAGSLFTANPGYTNETVAHWISAYFQGDKMRIPESAEEALALSQKQSAWMRLRYPGMIAWVNESYSGSLDFWTWPQAADELLEDMYLPTQRSRGNWLTWPFKVIEIKELATLSDERRAMRMGKRVPSL
ncbi:FAD/NAD(P)-binding domain-containing protein [Coprinopsis marcescibilis]|uniref:L-ornithine N(5)-monooxygenase [NAD(P)H] n=1 Tax=Coprinopsis marcescibilis TaxID=230819 RepID=A0A5C3KCH8_COPMA|nr:FAD/NAD(P)-binding domain-containing protein [Coprinopsis marcescibilis]